MHDQVTVIDQSYDREKYDIIINNANLPKTNNPCSKQLFFQFVIQYIRQFQKSNSLYCQNEAVKKKDISLISVFPSGDMPTISIESGSISTDTHVNRITIIEE